MPRKIRIAEAPPRIPAKVLEKEPLGDEVFRIRLESPFERWTPGDCVAVYAPGDSGVSRPYSLSHSVQAPFLELLVRRFAGGQVSPFLCDAEPGEDLLLSPPFGYFRPGEPEAGDKLFFATGTGIAPFLSHLRSGGPPPRQLFWGLRKPLNLDVPAPARTFLSRTEAEGTEKGRITSVLDEVSVSESTHVYACGLDRMIDEVLAYYKSRGLPESRLHRECFFTA